MTAPPKFAGYRDISVAQTGSKVWEENTPVPRPKPDNPELAKEALRRLQNLLDHTSVEREDALMLPPTTQVISGTLTVRGDTALVGTNGQGYGYAGFWNISTVPGQRATITNHFQLGSSLRSVVENFALNIANTKGSKEYGIQLIRCGQYNLSNLFGYARNEAGNFLLEQDTDAGLRTNLRCMESEGRMIDLLARVQDVWYVGLDLEATKDAMAQGGSVDAYRRVDPEDVSKEMPITDVMKYGRIGFWGLQLERFGTLKVNAGMVNFNNVQLTESSILFTPRSGLCRLSVAGGSAPSAYVYALAAGMTVEQTDALNWLARKPITIASNPVLHTGKHKDDHPSAMVYVPAGPGVEWAFISRQEGNASTSTARIIYRRADGTSIEESPPEKLWTSGAQTFSMSMRDDVTYWTCLGTASERISIASSVDTCPVTPNAYRNLLVNGTFGGGLDRPGTDAAGWQGVTAEVLVGQTLPDYPRGRKYVSIKGIGPRGAGAIRQLVPMRPGGHYMIVARVSKDMQMYVGQAWNGTAYSRSAKCVTSDEWAYPDGTRLLQIVTQCRGGGAEAFAQVSFGSEVAGGPHYIAWAFVIDLDAPSVCWTSGPPTEGVWAKDQVAYEINPKPGCPTKWVCVLPGAATVDNAAMMFRGVEMMAPAMGIQRPTFPSNVKLAAAYRGSTHIDTSVSPAGKPIMWNGAVWIDAMGKSV